MAEYSYDYLGRRISKTIGGTTSTYYYHGDQADILEYKEPECYSGTLYCPGKKFLAMNTDKALVNRDGWNTMLVRAEGNHIQIWPNGRQVADIHDETSDSGHIGFQVHTGEQFGPMKIIIREVLLRPPGNGN